MYGHRSDQQDSRVVRRVVAVVVAFGLAIVGLGVHGGEHLGEAAPSSMGVVGRPIPVPSGEASSIRSDYQEPSPSHIRIVIPSASPVRIVEPTATPAPVAPEPKKAISVVTGVATWYARPAGGAAAGPGLRKALGKGWRGKIVRVCVKECVVVRLDDWCLCSRGNRIIDLSRIDFAKLAPPSRGVIKVNVRY